MTELERYLFDLQGFIIVENALTPTQINELQQIINQIINQHNPSQISPEATYLRFDSLLGWGKPFRDIIDNPSITPYLQEILAGKFRLDHDYIHILRQGKGPVGANLHGGGTPYDPCQYYDFHQGKMYNGLTAVAYELNDVAPEDGGLACIPGSHKSNFSLPTSIRNLEQNPENLHPCIQKIAVKAGSAIIFTEALSHGTIPWRGKSERRTLFFKYSPHSSAWARYYYNLDLFPDLNDSQRQILRTPGIYP